jgi:hypothetical protein
MIAIVGVCILIAIGLETMYEPLGVVTKPLVILICIVGGFLIFKRIIYMVLRRTDNYDEFIWPTAPTNDTQLLTANDSHSLIDISGVELPFVCAASTCCNTGTVWSDASGCVVDTSLASA